VRFRRSLGFAWQGLAHAWRHQQNLRLEMLLLAAAVSISLWLGTGTALVLLSWTLVIAFEFMNTAIELTLDIAAPGHHELAGLAKDLAAASVLVMACCAGILNLVLLLPPLLLRLGISG
jgi:diacylglycerol kinase (ATP)